MLTAQINDSVSQAEMVGFNSTATRDAFSTMLGQEIVPAEAFVKRSATTAASGVVSLMGLAGKWTGTDSLSCSAAFACRLSSLLLMDECDSRDENVLDGVAEITNMIVGNVESEIEQRLGPMGLTVPTVIFRNKFSNSKCRKQQVDRGAFPVGGRVHARAALPGSKPRGCWTLRTTGLPDPSFSANVSERD